MINTIIKGDCVEVLDKIEGGIDLILTKAGQESPRSFNENNA